MNRITCTFFAVLLVSSFSALAEPSETDREHRKGMRCGPPAVALEACAESVDQDSCSFTGRNGDQLTGICEVKHDQLACVPEGHRERRRQNRYDD